MTNLYLERVAERACKPIAKGIRAGAKMSTGKRFSATESAAGKGVSEVLANERAA